MGQEIRYGDLIHEISVQQYEISANDLAPEIAMDAEGTEIPYQTPRIQLGGRDVYRLLRPYVTVRFMDQLNAVVPLAIYLVLFQLLILRQSVEGAGIMTGGLLAVIVGLIMFVEGLKLGLMPLGETIGNTLPHNSPLWVVLTIAFLLGVGVTFAEPAIGALKAAGQIVKVEKAPTCSPCSRTGRTSWSSWSARGSGWPRSSGRFGSYMHGA